MNDQQKNPSPAYTRNSWWSTSIIDMQPGVIRFFGYPIEELIGNVNFPQMIWLMLRGELPSVGQARLLDAVLMSSVDHGPQAPSIAISRISATCGIGLNGSMASAVNVLGDVHGGAGEQAVELFLEIDARVKDGIALDDATQAALQDFRADHGKYIPGYGHRFHPVDPRAPRLMELVREAQQAGVVEGRFREIGMAVERAAEEGGKFFPPQRTHPPLQCQAFGGSCGSRYQGEIQGRTVDAMRRHWPFTEKICSRAKR